MTTQDQDAPDMWQLIRQHPEAYENWQYEVANGDTLLGFLEFLEQAKEDNE